MLVYDVKCILYFCVAHVKILVKAKHTTIIIIIKESKEILHGETEKKKKKYAFN